MRLWLNVPQKIVSLFEQSYFNRVTPIISRQLGLLAKAVQAIIHSQNADWLTKLKAIFNLTIRAFVASKTRCRFVPGIVTINRLSTITKFKALQSV